MIVKVKRVKESDLPLPQFKTDGSAGMDIYADIDDNIEIPSGEVTLVPSGIAIAIPDGYECQIRSRSGLSLKQGLFCLNSPGTIDSDYRGEIKVILANFSKEKRVIERGERIAQMVFANYTKAELIEVEDLDQTSRGEGGFGSTGTK